MTLSILIPTYNDECLSLVRSLKDCSVSSKVEIIVADDGSTDEGVKAVNAQINDIDGCRIVFCPENKGRAGIRNYLASLAKGEWLLFVDSGNKIANESFIQRYLDVINSTDDCCAVYGGRTIDNKEYEGNLRYKYEHKWRSKARLSYRLAHPYNSFNTCNFLAHRSVLQRVPFNEDMKLYGFEDVLFGKQLQEAGVEIRHIDNPVSFEKFEDNAAFLRKTDESVRTQHEFAHLIGDHSTLLKTHRHIRSLHLGWLLKTTSRLFGRQIKRNILGKHPNIFLFNLYKLIQINSLS